MHRNRSATTSPAARRVGACPERSRGAPAAKPQIRRFRCGGGGDPPRKPRDTNRGAEAAKGLLSPFPALASLLTPALLLCGGLAAAILAPGCRNPAPTPEVRRPSVRQDACAARLHDLCGRLLLHYSLHQRLPQTLEALPPLDPDDPTPTVCPASGEPYVYRPDGLRVPDHPGLLVLYDPLPSHAGMRWGVFVDKVTGGGRLTARVVLVPEEAIRAAKPASPSPEPAPAEP